MPVPALLRRGVRTGRTALALTLLSFGAVAILGSSTAMAASTSLSVVPCTSADGCTAPSSTAFTPGGADSVFTTVGFNTSDYTASQGPTNITLRYAPGFLASLSADPSCVATTDETDTKCEIGSGAINTELPSPDSTIPFTAYLVPPPSSGDLAGIDFVPAPGSGLGTVHGAISVSAPPTDSTYSTPSLVLDVPLGDLAESQYITSIDLGVNGTLAGNTLIHLPTACTPPAKSSVEVTYGNGDTEPATASQDISFSQCSSTSLPFSPTLSASAVKSATSDSVQLTTITKQTAGQAGVKTVALGVPASVFTLNLANAYYDLSNHAQVGDAYAVSPLVPGVQDGTVTAAGSAINPEITISFPQLGISYTGTSPIAPKNGYYTTTFSYNGTGATFAPDVPLSEVAVVFNDGTKTGVFTTKCSPSTGTLTASYTSQEGASAKSSSAVTVKGCASTTVGKPTVSGGSASGLKKGKPSLGFTLTAGKNAPDISSFTLSLPKGLSLNKKGVPKGVSLSGAKLKSAKVSGSKLTITLKSAAASLKLKLSDKALKVSKSLQKKVKDKKTKSLTLKLSVKNAKGASTSLSLKVTKLS